MNHFLNFTQFLLEPLFLICARTTGLSKLFPSLFFASNTHLMDTHFPANNKPIPKLSLGIFQISWWDEISLAPKNKV